MHWINSFDDMLDFLSVVIVHAPDDFPKEDYLCDEDQLTLDLAFEELSNGMKFVAERIQNDKVLQELKGILDASLASYRRKDDVQGAHYLQDFERIVLDSSR